jgi:hypothetical protein
MAYPNSIPLPGGGSNLQTARFDPQQMAARSQLLQTGMQNYSPEASQNRAQEQFHKNTIPSLAERFTAMGGGQRSSAFQGALGQASADLESQLDVNRQNFGLQALGLGLQPQFESHLQASPYQGLLGGLGAAAPDLLRLGAEGVRGYLGGGGNVPGQQQNQGTPGSQGSSQGSNLANLASTGAGIASAGTTLAGTLGGWGSAIGAGLTAAAPFALPAIAATVAGYILYNFLSGD